MRTIIQSSLLALLGCVLLQSESTAQSEQTILGPGLYVFQTRTREASCGDDSRTGYVSSFVAPIHGVPGSRRMRMQILNSEWWPEWRLQVTADNRVVGTSTMRGQSGPNAPRNQFDVARDGDRFVGQGTRTYTTRVDGRPQECSVTFDALLRQIDLL